MFFYAIPAIFLFFFVKAFIFRLYQNEQVEQIKFIGLQGSASYLIKGLDLEGQLIPILQQSTIHYSRLAALKRECRCYSDFCVLIMESPWIFNITNCNGKENTYLKTNNYDKKLDFEQSISYLTAPATQNGSERF